MTQGDYGAVLHSRAGKHLLGAPRSEDTVNVADSDASMGSVRNFFHRRLSDMPVGTAPPTPSPSPQPNHFNPLIPLPSLISITATAAAAPASSSSGPTGTLGREAAQYAAATLVGAAALNLFMQVNFTGPALDDKQLAAVYPLEFIALSNEAPAESASSAAGAGAGAGAEAETEAGDGSDSKGDAADGDGDGGEEELKPLPVPKEKPMSPLQLHCIALLECNGKHLAPCMWHLAVARSLSKHPRAQQERRRTPLCSAHSCWLLQLGSCRAPMPGMKLKTRSLSHPCHGGVDAPQWLMYVAPPAPPHLLSAHTPATPPATRLARLQCCRFAALTGLLISAGRC